MALIAIVAGVAAGVLAQVAVRTRAWSWRAAAALFGLGVMLAFLPGALGDGGSVVPIVIVATLIAASYAFSPRDKRTTAV
ncbi:hypothetical protein [Cellulomonas iranensis]|uniref:hypothetical protein n=1 Tax=Cellulomonas iranensis TaxID=76862 RepID=UPI000B3D26C6|nr:hypothetical protein [Cellulomonas iranensis]UCN14392.1 hypothetical protein LFM56_16200 [Cellulomonas iranensis]